MGVWALRFAPGAELVAPLAWCCAVMFCSRRGLCGPMSAVMSLELDGAILHISAAAGERVFRARLFCAIEGMTPVRHLTLRQARAVCRGCGRR